jgi:ADP-ribose pyrophosphatase YjhB (NUDIX family)
MFRKPIRFAWKVLPPWLRLKIIRTTQQKFTVSAAAVITNDEGKVLLLNHLLRPYSGWGLPGGFLTAKEQAEEAIKRELLEETGIGIENVEMFRVRTIARHVEILFRASAATEGTVQSREILELGWFAVDELPEGLPASQRKLLASVLDPNESL